MKSIFVIIQLFLLISLSACNQSSTQPLRLGTNLWLGYEPLYIAERQEYWSEKDIRLVEYPSASEVLRAFRNQAIEAASLTLDEALLLKNDGVPIKIILIHDFSNGADVIMARPPIQTINQLKGKKVAVEGTALGAFFLSRALQQNNISQSDIEIVNIDVNLHASAYKSGKVDAVVTFEPVRTELLNSGATEIFSSQSIPGEIVDVLVVHEEYLATHPRVIAKLLDGWFSALEFIQENENDAYQLISERTKMSVAEVGESMHLLQTPNRDSNMIMLSNDGKLYETLKLLNQVLIDIGRLNQQVNMDDLVTNRYL